MVKRATSAPPAPRTTSTAPATGRGLQVGSSGFSTGQVGPATTRPATPVTLAAARSWSRTSAGTAGPRSSTRLSVPSPVTSYVHVCSSMHPAGQSPQPTRKVTRQPSASGTASHQCAWPMRSGSLGPIPSNMGDLTATSLAAASGESTDTGLGVGEAVVGLPQAARTSATARNRSRAAERGRACMARGRGTAGGGSMCVRLRRREQGRSGTRARGPADAPVGRWIPHIRCLVGCPDRWSACRSRRSVCSSHRTASLAWTYHRTGSHRP